MSAPWRLRPDYAEAFNNRAVALWSLKQFAESLADCDRAIALRPDFADAYYNRGNALAELNRPQEALASYEQALAIPPDHPRALSGLANAAMTIGDWARTAELADVLKADVLAGKSVIQPFVLMGYWDDNELQLRCSQNYVRQAGPGPQPPLWTGERYNHDRIRIAYLSADFHQHVTAALTVEMFERHDRERFEITAVSFGPDDNSAMRARLVKAFDRFHDARQQSDREVAELLRQWEIDIAVDLGGHTSGARPWVLAHRPAPIQAKYMGYPGTSGSDFHRLHHRRPPGGAGGPGAFLQREDRRPARHAVGDRHPAHGWPAARPAPRRDCRRTRLCLLLLQPQLEDHAALVRHLDAAADTGGGQRAVAAGRQCQHPRKSVQGQAAARGVAPERLIFAGRTTPEQHLARQQLADLFLDTLPYNAHTTASDALWAGLPLLTLPGRSFPARRRRQHPAGSGPARTDRRRPGRL